MIYVLIYIFLFNSTPISPGYWMVKDHAEIHNNKIPMINFSDLLMFYCNSINRRTRYVNEILNLFRVFVFFVSGIPLYLIHESDSNIPVQSKVRDHQMSGNENQTSIETVDTNCSAYNKYINVCCKFETLLFI